MDLHRICASRFGRSSKCSDIGGNFAPELALFHWIHRNCFCGIIRLGYRLCQDYSLSFTITCIDNFHKRSHSYSRDSEHTCGAHLWIIPPFRATWESWNVVYLSQSPYQDILDEGYLYSTVYCLFRWIGTNYKPSKYDSYADRKALLLFSTSKIRAWSKSGLVWCTWDSDRRHCWNEITNGN